MQMSGSKHASHLQAKQFEIINYSKSSQRDSGRDVITLTKRTGNLPFQPFFSVLAKDFGATFALNEG
jgi:hypothetical protein